VFYDWFTPQRLRPRPFKTRTSIVSARQVQQKLYTQRMRDKLLHNSIHLTSTKENLQCSTPKSHDAE
jgi:hypothetical protein